MAQVGTITLDDQVVIGEEVNHVRLITLNRPRQLNVISSKTVSLLAEYLEKWENDDDAKLVIFKGVGRAFSAGGDLKMFYDGRDSYDSCLDVVYRMYWLCYHNHTYKKTQVTLAHGISMGGGASLMVPMKFSVVTEKTVFSMPEASIGFHTDCSFSYILPRLPGHMGEYLALTGARLSGKELVAAGLATHYVPSENLPMLEKCLIELNSGDEHAVKSVIEEFTLGVTPVEESILHKQAIIDKCFSKESVREIIQSLEVEASNVGNEWIGAVLKDLKRSSPTGLQITFRSWNPATLEEVTDEKVDLVFQPFKEDLELHIPNTEANRWDGKYESSVYPSLRGEKLKYLIINLCWSNLPYCNATWQHVTHAICHTDIAVMNVFH